MNVIIPLAFAVLAVTVIAVNLALDLRGFAADVWAAFRDPHCKGPAFALAVAELIRAQIDQKAARQHGNSPGRHRAGR